MELSMDNQMLLPVDQIKTETGFSTIILDAPGDEYEVEEMCTNKPTKHEFLLPEGKLRKTILRKKKRGPQKKVYTCPLCQKELVGMVVYNYHMKHIHRKACTKGRGAQKKNYLCSICNKQIIGAPQYRIHMKRIHRVNLNYKSDRILWSCPVCMIIVRKNKLDFHLKENHQTSLDELSPFSCSKCPRIFQRFANLLNHEKNVHMESSVSQNFVLNTEAAERISKSETFTFCTKCEKSFSSHQWLVRHQVKCLSDNILPPNQKKQNGEQNSNPDTEVDETSNSKSLTYCTKCEKSFSSHQWLIRHQMKCKSNFLYSRKKRKNFTPRSYSKRNTQEAGETLNSKTLAFCTKCKKSFYSYQWLTRHHMKCGSNNLICSNKQNGKVFNCSHCPAKFTFECNRIRHEKNIHPKKYNASNDGPSSRSKSSNVCTKLTKKKSPIKRTPGGVKIVYAHELYCSYCPKSFAHITSKQLHEKLHTGDLPYECKNCKASFRIPCTLTTHEKKCSMLFDGIWCSFCDFHSESRSKLEIHCQSAHGFNLNEYETFLQKKDGNKYESESIKEEPPIVIKDDDSGEEVWSQFIVIDDDDDDDDD